MAKKLLEAEDLIRRAKSGEKLETDKRRHAVGYLMATQPELSANELSQLFDCDERTIRNDRSWVRQQAAELVKQEDIALVISDIRMAYERYRDRVEKAVKRAQPGTRVYLDYLNSAMNMELKVVDALQSLGWYPKNLGQLTKKEFSFHAIVTKDGTVDTRPVDMLDHLIETPRLASGDSAKREALDAEFSDLPKGEDSSGGTGS